MIQRIWIPRTKPSTRQMTPRMSMSEVFPLIRFSSPVCAETGYRPDHGVHAHVHGPYRGWICFEREELTGYPSLVAHEIAHVMVGHTGHTTAWMRQYRELGGPALRSVQARSTMTRFSRGGPL